MMDYFEMVPRTAPSELKTYVVETDADGIVTVTPPGSARPLRFELTFDTPEDRDDFLNSPRRRMDAARCGGSLTLLTPNDLLSPNDGRQTEQGLISRLALKVTAKALGLSETDIRVGFMRAWSAVTDWYQQR